MFHLEMVCLATKETTLLSLIGYSKVVVESVYRFVKSLCCRPRSCKFLPSISSYHVDPQLK